MAEAPGERGWEFEKKGYQERNLQNLLQTLSTREAQKTITELAKIDKEEWKLMGGVINEVQELATTGIAGLSDVGVASDLLNSLKDTLRTEFNALLAPLKNELMNMINQLIAPLLPAIQASINEIMTFLQTSFNAWEAILTLDKNAWEQLFLEFQKVPELMDIKEKWHTLLAEWATVYREFDLIMRTGYSYEDLNRMGTAGGLYSGQFDVSPEVWEDIINNMNLPNIDIDLNLEDTD